MMTTMTYADILRPAVPRAARIYDAVAVLGGSLLIALFAQISFQVQLGAQAGPVPLTGQTFGVILAGVLLGSRRGFLCLTAYLAEGAMGLPVFANGHVGLAYLMGPTGGYLAAFPAAAWFVGRMAERGWDRRTFSTLAMMTAGLALILSIGTLWLAALIGFDNALAAGFYPFLPGELLKICLATTLLPSGWRILSRLGLSNRSV